MIYSVLLLLVRNTGCGQGEQGARPRGAYVICDEAMVLLNDLRQGSGAAQHATQW
jgi:hypothetical protein